MNWKTSVWATLIAAAGLAYALSSAAAAPPEILVLSNRADLISGGDALVEIKWPAGANVALAKVAVDGVNVKPMFAMRANGRYMGVVTGLKNGNNVLTARIPGAGAQITINNHPIGGPVFSGAQLQPWICATTSANTQIPVTANNGQTAIALSRASGLPTNPAPLASSSAAPTDCQVAPLYTYYYQPITKPSSCTYTISGAAATRCFEPYPVNANNPANRPADALIADFTNDRGVTAKSLIRVERGTLNRTIYQLVTYFDPAVASAPWAPQKGWNGKLVWRNGASAAVSRFQSPPANPVDDDKALRRGFMVATSSLTDHGTNSNDTLGAETVMMVKERIAEQYGPIRYTIADGCSGGSIMQHSIASAYPGLFDGIQPNCSFPDTFSTFIEIAECGALVAHYYAVAPGSALTVAQRNAINGHKAQGFCTTWIAAFLPAGDPTRFQNCGFSNTPPSTSGTLGYSATNGTGIRCDGTDHDVGMVGTFVDTDGRVKANPPNDNVGVQYGLKALAAGTITPEQFVQVQEGVGGYNADLIWSVASRMKADPGVLHTYYSGGLVSDGRQLAKVPIIDLRGNETATGDIHANWRAWALRDRLDRDHGGHANQLIWAFLGGGAAQPGTALTIKSFVTLDTWLANIEADGSADPLEVKVVNNKPSDAKDMCLNSTGATQAQIDAALPLNDPACTIKFEASPRIAAGGPLAENIFKCTLKPIDFGSADYNGMVFNSDQQSRLAAVFPDGVCDWTVPGVGQVPVNPWTTFAAGPGGVPLGAPPASVPIP